LREYIVHPGAVVILAVLDNGRLLFERQFRYPLRRVFLELPAGKIDPGEAILDTGRRELLEETGYVASDWEYLGVMHPCIGYSDERIEIFAGARAASAQQKSNSITTSFSRSSSFRRRKPGRRSGAVRLPTPRPSPRCSGSNRP
jgi:8-oxo-dGTP pyrophosphatase MutT (NUDIX family)